MTKKYNKRPSSKDYVSEDKHQPNQTRVPVLVDVVQENKEKDKRIDVLQAQVDELKDLLKTITRGKQKAIDPKNNIIEFSDNDTMIIEVEAGKEFSLLGSDRKDHDHKKDFRTLKKSFQSGQEQEQSEHYVNANFNQASKVRRTQKCEFNYEEFAPDEEKAPKQIGTFSSPPPPFEDLNNVNNRDEERDNRSRKSRSVISEEYDSNSEETDDK
ncbi:5400_t:CDS:2 [Funneliformis caledonium]|uniref:5400_t:CDS:1 n=1 Tax=Funneliformis caledonium TaxID=1117310 RepID=A0A9N9BLM1_9GLOM|nr:5400_t:CDS:2 [Funneliformis caledonium]